MMTSLMMAVILFALGVGIMGMGALFLVACIMPTFGGSRGSEAMQAIVGVMMVGAGLALVFFAGGL